ncbi:Uncharacterised protein [Capnocytophaga canimorsus]|nr:hypothetical protein CLV61_1255 [Capnocytophaga canimorsus]STA73077.1 Uncharacterised protein [Capnocytophaga canimorsus]VEJ20002.1 Uncharacterised protein [Capnocytophaga canimorsus]
MYLSRKQKALKMKDNKQNEKLRLIYRIYF